MGFPDFMEKPGKSFEADNLLGQLYRRCKSVGADIELGSLPFDGHLDERLVVDGADSFMASAETDYLAYAEAIRRLMVRYGMQSECEVLWTEDEFSSNCSASLYALKDQVQPLHKQVRDRFYHDGRLGHGTDAYRGAVRRKASAWYQIAYGSAEKLLSFPWIMSDEMIETMAASTSARTSANDADSFMDIGLDMRALWRDSEDYLEMVLSRKEVVFSRICNAMKTAGADIEALKFGSVELLLCDAVSDLDVYTAVPNLSTEQDTKEQELLFFERYVIPAVDNVAAHCELKSTPAIPIVKLWLDSDTVDICARRDGLLKARLIRTLYKMHDCFLVFVSSMMEWAKLCGVIRGTDGGAAMVKNGEFHAILVSFLMKLLGLNAEELCEQVETYQRESDADIIRRAHDCNSAQLGQLVVAFMQYGASVDFKAKFEFEWPVAGSPLHTVPETVMEAISSKCYRSLHTVAVSRSWSSTLRLANAAEGLATSLTWKLERGLSETIAHAKDFHAARLSLLTGCDVRIEEVDADDVCLQIQGTGTAYNLHRLRKEILRFISSSRMQYAGIVRSEASRYFMEGSTFVFSRFAESKAAMVSIDKYLGPFATCRHSILERSWLALSSERYEGWKMVFVEGLKSCIISQIRSGLDTKLAETLRFSIHFGSFYLLNSSFAFERRVHVSLDDMERMMNNGRRNRASADRPDYDPDGDVDFEIHVDDDATSKDEPEAKPKQSGQRQPPPKPRRVNRRLACGYYSGMCSPDSIPQDGEWMNTIAKIACALISTGFTRTQGRVNFSTGGYSDSRWLVSMNLSANYEASIGLDKDLGIHGVCERPLSWVHGTLLEGTRELELEETRKFDVRFKVTTTVRATQGDPLFRSTCPNDKAPIVLVDDRPRPRDDLPVGTANRVAFCRRVDERVLFEYTSPHDQCCPPVHMYGVVSKGAHYEGLALDDIENFADFSLEIDPAPLLHWLDDNSVRVDEWLHRVISKVLEVSEVLPWIQ